MRFRGHIFSLIPVLLLSASILLFQDASVAQGNAITAISAAYSSAPQTTYTTTGLLPTSDFPSTSTYNVIFGSASTSDNDFILNTTAAFTSGTDFDLVQMADELRIRRNAVSASGKKEVIGLEYRVLPSISSGSTVDIRSSQLSSMEEDMLSLKLNLSGDQSLINTTTGQSFSNVERFDYLFHAGLRTLTPDNSGFTIFERGGNDGFVVSAILQLDINGDPSQLGPLVSVSSSKYGPALKSLDQTIFNKEGTSTVYKPTLNLSGQSVHGVFMSYSDLGIAANQTFYGYAILASDVTSNAVDWTDSSIYPTNTGSSNGVDLCPGGGAYSSDGKMALSDIDGDGKEDLTDLDDDNDGLLDLTEVDCSSNSWHVGWFHGVDDEATIMVPDLVLTGHDESYGPGLSGSTGGTLLQLSGISASTLSESIANQEYVEYSFTTKASLSTDFFLSGVVQYETAPGNYNGHQLAVFFSNDGFTNSSELIRNITTLDGPGYQSYDVSDKIYQFDQATTYTLRVYLYNIPPANSGQATLDDFTLNICEGDFDADEDGVWNHLDLDSDNDGCLDAIEAGFTDADMDGEVDGTGYAADGTVTGSDGYTGTDPIVTDPDLMTAMCDTDGDGVSPSADLDDDNDGILDSIESQCTASSMVIIGTINEGFDGTTVGQKVGFGGTGGLEGTLITDSYNDKTVINSSSHNAEIVSALGPFGVNSLMIDADQMAAGADLTRQGQFSFIENIDLIQGVHYRISADLYYSTLHFSNEFGTIIHAPGQDAVWNDDVVGEIDGFMTFRLNQVLQRGPNSSLSPGTVTPTLINDRWYRQEAEYYTENNGSGILHLYVDVRTAMYTAGVLGAYTDNLAIDLGVASTMSWLSNASIGLTVDSYADNVTVQWKACDSDGDGIPDYLDLDSDNDGIYDAVESGSGEAQTAGALNGGVDTDGIPLSVSNGSSGVDYTYADTDADSTLNPYDSDSDGDGCPDVTEAGFPDADGDQQLGGLVPPTVDAQGVVTSGGL